MSNAFQIVVDDVLSVLASAGHSKSIAGCIESDAKEFFQLLDLGGVENAALYGDSIEQQTEYAHEEIKSQLVRMGCISLSTQDDSQKANT